VQLVFGQDELVAQWVGINLGVTIHPPFTAIGGTKDGRTLCTGAVFNQFNGSSIEITVFSVGRLDRGCLRAASQYVFGQLGANRLSARTRKSNKRMRKHLPRLGFAFEGTLKNYYGPGEDALMFRLDPAVAKKWMPHGLS
jgi:hypothetical protein